MQAGLPTELLRTFVEVVDAGSMLKASERVFLTPSAVSLQIKRLEETVGTALFFRDKRNLSLTGAGETLLRYAQRILSLSDEAYRVVAGLRASGPVRLGMVEDFARTLLTGALRRFAEHNPDVHLQLRVCGSRELSELIETGRLDLALGLRVPSEPHVVAARHVHWFGNEKLLDRPVLPLAMLTAPCLFRGQMVAALQAAGIAFDITVETASISALQAAVAAGLGVTSRTAAFMPDDQHLRLSALPALPGMGLSLIEGGNPSPAIDALKTILLDSLTQL